MASMNFSNTVNNTASGTTNGASAGSAAGPWGALIGGAAGGITGLFTGLYSDYQNKKTRQNAENYLNDWQTEAEKILEDSYKNQARLSSDGDVETYKKLRSSYNPNNYVYDFGKFDTSKYNVEDYLNPNKEAILNDIGKSVQHTAAGSALGHSSGTLSSIVAQQMSKDEQLYKDARDAMNQEKSFDYGMYQDYITNMQNKLNAQNSGYLQQMNMLSDDIKFDQQNEDNYTTNKLNLGNSIANSKVNLLV